MPGHSPIFDFAPEAIPYHEFVTLAPFVYETRGFRKVVASVGIAQNNKFTTSVLDALAQRAAVTLADGVHDAGTSPLRHLDRRVGRTIVGDHHLAADAGFLERAKGLVDASAQRPLFVQARNDYGNFRAGPGPRLLHGIRPLNLRVIHDKHGSTHPLTKCTFISKERSPEGAGL